jgi:hypothetical protein
MALSDEERRKLLTRAAAWLEAQGFVEDALRAFAAAGAHEELAALLAERGEAMLSAGAVDAVVRHTELLPDTVLSTPVVLLSRSVASMAPGPFRSPPASATRRRSGPRIRSWRSLPRTKATA